MLTFDLIPCCCDLAWPLPSCFGQVKMDDSYSSMGAPDLPIPVIYDQGRLKLAILQLPGPLVSTRQFKRNTSREIRKCPTEVIHAIFAELEKDELGSCLPGRASLYFAKRSPSTMDLQDNDGIKGVPITFMQYRERYYTNHGYWDTQDNGPMLQQLLVGLDHIHAQEIESILVPSNLGRYMLSCNNEDSLPATWVTQIFEVRILYRWLSERLQ